VTCAKQVVTAVVENEGRRWEGSNACRFPQARCPRGGMATGEGYELCRDVCGQDGHAEIAALRAAGDGARGSVLTLHGHTYCCDACLRAMSDAGVAEVVVAATGERFTP